LRSTPQERTPPRPESAEPNARQRNPPRKMLRRVTCPPTRVLMTQVLLGPSPGSALVETRSSTSAIISAGGVDVARACARELAFGLPSALTDAEVRRRRSPYRSPHSGDELRRLATPRNG
jgi:hypothetical protein